MQWIVDSVIEFTLNSPLNSLGQGSSEKAWKSPLVGFASAADPIFEFFRDDIGPGYWHPLDAFDLAYNSETAVLPHDLTVISWILPQTAATRRSNRKEKSLPSERWIRVRKYGEEFNVALREYLVETLKQRGIRSVAPMLLEEWNRCISQEYGYSSNWSERHAAFAAGLGTFGLCDGLITEKGKAVRCGSIIAELKCKPNNRPYSSHREYCRFFHDGGCGKCMARCPAEAISLQGHNKTACREHIRQTAKKSAVEKFGLDVNACGLCQVKVPCEAANPVNKSRLPK